MDELKQIWPDWEIVEVIGQGSYGSVLKAKRSIRGYEDIYSAIKIVTLPLNNSELSSLKSSGMDFYTIRNYYRDMAEKLIAEISIMQSLKSVNEIVKIEDFKIIEDPHDISWRIYIRMELLSSLGDYAASHPFTTQDVVRLAMDVCRGLARCQEKGIIHRDIKPANILVDEFGKFKLADFGIARQVGDQLAASTKAGSENYMAPEVYRGETYDQSVDIYSLGIMMYQFLNNGRMPFLPGYPQPVTSNDLMNSRLRRLQGDTPPPPVNADETLSSIVLKACAFHPEHRYHTAAEMLRDLERWSQGIAVEVEEAKEEETQTLLPSWIAPLIIGIAAVAAVIVFVITRPSGKTKVDLLKNVELAYTYNSDGTMNIDRSQTQFDVSYDQNNVNAKAFVSIIDKSIYVFSQETNLSSGDQIEVSVNVDQETLDTYEVRLAKKKRKLIVGGEASSTQSSTTQTSGTKTTATIISATGTNSLGQGYIGDSGRNYGPQNMIDGDLSTALNTKGDGRGAEVRFTLFQETELYDVTLYNGYCKSTTVYYNNNRVSQCTLTFDDGTTEVIKLNDTFATPQTITFASRHVSRSVRLRIDGVYLGSKYTDTCLSEISFNSHN